VTLPVQREGRRAPVTGLASFRWSGWFFLALLLLALPAFWPTYLSKAPRAVDAYTHLHAAIALGWCLLLIVQPLLISREHRTWHRRLGGLAWILGPAMIVASVLLASQRFRAMDDTRFAQDSSNLYLPLSAAMLFAVPWCLALWHRKKPLLHGRFMIATGLVMVDPVVGRALFFYLPPLPGTLTYQAITFSLELAVLAWLAVRPPLTAMMRRQYVRGVMVFPLVHLGWFTLAQGGRWHSFAAWFRALPLTP
jgi:hypothetical protein